MFPPVLEKKTTDIKSAAVMFLVPPHEGVIEEIRGLELLNADENIVRYSIQDCKDKEIGASVDNDCYLGHIITKDTVGLQARKYVENAIKNIELVYKTSK